MPSLRERLLVFLSDNKGYWFSTRFLSMEMETTPQSVLQSLKGLRQQGKVKSRKEPQFGYEQWTIRPAGLVGRVDRRNSV